MKYINYTILSFFVLSPLLFYFKTYFNGLKLYRVLITFSACLAIWSLAYKVNYLTITLSAIGFAIAIVSLKKREKILDKINEEYVKEKEKAYEKAEKNKDKSEIQLISIFRRGDQRNEIIEGEERKAVIVFILAFYISLVIPLVGLLPAMWIILTSNWKPKFI
jgi:Flp pilus assembly protein TadB